MLAKQLYDSRKYLMDETIEDEIRNIPITGGITASPISFNQTYPNQSNIAYDERLGYVDLNTGQPINMAMPGATQAGVSDKQKQVIGGQMFGLKEGMFTPQDVYDKTKKFDDLLKDLEFVETTGPPKGKDVDIRIIGNDINILSEISGKMKNFLKKQKGIFSY